MRTNLIFLVLLCSCIGSSEKLNEFGVEEALLFTKINNLNSGIDFVNKLEKSERFDVFRYRNYYNGGGVAIGDINNDGLPDIYFTANTGPNRLYVNKGGFNFEDITEDAGVEGTKAWSTGVSMVDINDDGFLDIYVCNSGNIDGDDRENELFINKGNLTFSEQAHAYNLANKGFSTHAAFFDYDRDGDLDAYLLNNSFRPISTLGYRNLRNERDGNGGDKLMRNDNGFFVDVSEEAGIYGSVIGFGLGISVGDVNRDGWQDIYISNDFYERDYLYLNNQDGTFSEVLEDQFDHISLSSMGADVADINNDALPDIFVTDMLPDNDVRLKTLSAFESYDFYSFKLDQGYHHQLMQNTLQINNGNGFSDWSHTMNVAATDWSWGALVVDMDNNGYKDIFVANGIFRDVTDQDFINFLSSQENLEAARRGEKVDFEDWINKIPSTPLLNKIFSQDTARSFRLVSKEWGFNDSTFSNGAAYGDLDNDGDLDFVLNNLNQPAIVYRNNSDSTRSFLKISFDGPPNNRFGIGSTVEVFSNSQILFQELIPNKGFQSSMEPKLIFGLGNTKEIDSLKVVWPDGKIQCLHGVEVPNSITLSYENAGFSLGTNHRDSKKYEAQYEDITDQIGLDYVHQENSFVDFDRERLLYHMLSKDGPAMAVGDINADGLDDLYLGGAKNQAGCIYLQNRLGNFDRLVCFDDESISEDTDARFFDANNDGLLDLFVCSGGYEYSRNAPALQDRLYLNRNGQEFIKAELPMLPESTSTVEIGDVDNDGDQDMFLGIRAIPWFYGIQPSSHILVNDGTGSFSIDKKNQSTLQKIGMVKDAVWSDIDADKDIDLIVVGEWMPVMVFLNTQGLLTELQPNTLKYSNGWWNSTTKSDLDGDGDEDFIITNNGTNSRFKASKERPVSLYVNDFDGNRTIDYIHTFRKEDGKDYPYTLKQDLEKQIPMVKKKFVMFKEYADKSIDELFGDTITSRSVVNVAYTFETSILWNRINENGTMELEALPIDFQISRLNTTLEIENFDNNYRDFVFGGNFYGTKPESGRYDSHHGTLLRHNIKNNEFEVIPPKTSGFYYKGEVRKMALLTHATFGTVIVTVRNNNSPLFFRIDE